MVGGFSARQRAKTQARMQAAAEKHLRPGEQPRAAVFVYDLSYKRFLPIFVVLVAVQVPLALQGMELKPWVPSAIIGAGVALVNRFYSLLLTADRLVLLRNSNFSTKRTKLEEEIPLTRITSARYVKGLIGGRLDLEVDGKRRRYSVGRPFRGDAESFAQQLARGSS